MKYDNGADYGYKILDSLFSVEEYRKKYIAIYKINCSAKLEVAYFHEHDIPVAAIVDSNPVRQNDWYCGIEILDPKEVLPNLPENAIIILSSANGEAFLKELAEYGQDVLDKVIHVNLVDYDKYPNTLPKKDASQFVSLKEVQEEVFQILKWFDGFCKENSFRYYIHFGTLLGAVRHKGFIPWDDDIDVAMPMPDYIRCCELLSNDSTYGFDSILNPNQEKLSISLISKIRSNTLFSEYRNFPLRLETAVGVDIFPLGGFPVNESEQNIYMRELVDMGDIWKEKVVIPYDTSKYSEDVHRKLINEAVSIMSRYDYDNSEYVADVYCNRFIRNHLNRGVPRRYYDKQITLCFEGEEIIAPSGYDYILEKFYGDYMKIPDEKNRAKRTYDKVYRI